MAERARRLRLIVIIRVAVAQTGHSGRRRRGDRRCCRR